MCLSIVGWGSAMNIKALHHQMAQYNAWKRQLSEQLANFEAWGKEYRLISTDSYRSLQHARKLLEREYFTIACVGEFSRGKTELINALLYNDTFTRLLPSLPGRTTMCPTEIYWDPSQPKNCVRLLPIETRHSMASLQNFKKIPQNWRTISFDPESPASISAAIDQVSASKRVSIACAKKLGFEIDEFDVDDPHGQVSIPTWRHALINLDHALLREGLRIVDTPGLNALGNEPELTLKTLPDAQAILFLLSADSGVSASDMKIWREHIQCLQDDNCTAILALLNKIDTLWDDLSPPEVVTANIETMRQQTAQHLQLSPEHVLPISARVALTAKLHNHKTELERSNFPQLEKQLAECVVRSQQQLIAHRLVSDSYDAIVSSYTSLSRHIVSSETLLAELQESQAGNMQANLMRQHEKIRTAHHRHRKQSLSLRTSQRLLKNQRRSLKAPILPERLQQLIDETHERMHESWTTVGLSRTIDNFFDDVDANMNHLLREIERANKVLTSIYARPEHGINNAAIATKHKLNITRQRRQLRNLQSKARQFSSSINSVFSTKQVLIKRFTSTLVKETKVCYQDIAQAIDTWLEEALAPLLQNNHYQKQLLEHHMLNLAELQHNSSSHAEQLQAIEKNIDKLQDAHRALEPMYKKITTEPAMQTSTTAEVISLQKVRQAQQGG